MKRLWNMISFLAVVNLLAMGIFVGWMWQTGRLNIDRLRSLRESLMVTSADEAASMQTKEAAEQRARAEAEDLARRENPPLPSSVALRRNDDNSMRDAQIVRRLVDEKALLVDQLSMKTQQIEAERAAFEAERAAWQSATADERQRLTDTQFAKVVDLYSSIPAKQAKEMLINLVRTDDADQAVAYLNAMEIRAAAKIIKELKTDAENQLATDLLEQLRTHGLGATAMESTGNEPTADNPARSPANEPL
ncbi:MAG: hypothetical protein KC983_08525 [Phycisphaerales bacterium]|nr:hypothetical protein [Phycisphaerales bacterium]